MELTRAFVFHEALRSPSLGGIPAELCLSPCEVALLLSQNILPSFVDERLVKQPINDSRMGPVRLRLACFEVPSNVLHVSFPGRMEGSTEAASPVLPLPEILDNLLGMGACLAPMRRLVMLVESIGSPEATVATRLGARILLPSLVEFFFVPLPVVLSLESRFT